VEHKGVADGRGIFGAYLSVGEWFNMADKQAHVSANWRTRWFVIIGAILSLPTYWIMRLRSIQVS